MQHLTMADHLSEEQLVLLHYRDLDDPAAQQHLAGCLDCRTELESIRAMLAVVDEAAAVPERGAGYETEVWNVLRWKLGAKSRRGSRFLAPLAAAAAMVLVFFAGVWWNGRSGPGTSKSLASTTGPSTGTSMAATTNTVAPALAASTSTEPAPLAAVATATVATASASHDKETHVASVDPKTELPPAPRQAPNRDSRIAVVRDTKGAPAAEPRVRERILLLVLADHFDSSERMLIELANANPQEGLDITTEQKRSEELLASNRIYRQTASHNGDNGVASVLDDLEPLLTQIARSPSRLSPAELSDLQKRIEAKGILFKVRVLGSQVDRSEAPAPGKSTNTL